MSSHKNNPTKYIGIHVRDKQNYAAFESAGTRFHIPFNQLGELLRNAAHQEDLSPYQEAWDDYSTISDDDDPSLCLT